MTLDRPPQSDTSVSSNIADSGSSSAEMGTVSSRRTTSGMYQPNPTKKGPTWGPFRSWRSSRSGVVDVATGLDQPVVAVVVPIDDVDVARPRVREHEELEVHQLHLHQRFFDFSSIGSVS